MVESPDALYSTSTAAKKANISIKQLYYWEQIGIIKPRYERFGLRQFRRYDKDDIDVLRTIKRLLDRGFTLKAAIQKTRSLNKGKPYQGERKL